MHKPRTAAQLQRQAEVFLLSVERGLSIRAIAEKLGIDRNTVLSDLRHEQSLRAEELADRRAFELLRATEFYFSVIRTAQDRAKTHSKDTLKSLAVALRAREALDRLLSLQPTTRVEVDGLSALTNALRAGADREKTPATALETPPGWQRGNA